MVGKEIDEHKDFLERAINYLKERGFTNIKTDLPGYESPKTFVKKKGGTNLSADISAHKNGRKYFFDISLKSFDPSKLKSKWLLLDTVARLRSNRFKIITTKGHFKFTDTLLKDVNLSSKEPIKI